VVGEILCRAGVPSPDLSVDARSAVASEPASQSKARIITFAVSCLTTLASGRKRATELMKIGLSRVVVEHHYTRVRSTKVIISLFSSIAKQVAFQ